jgi:hypothetical protein
MNDSPDGTAMGTDGAKVRKDVPLAVAVQVAEQSASDAGVAVPVRSAAFDQHEYLRGVLRKESLTAPPQRR